MQVWRLNNRDAEGGMIVDDPGQLLDELGVMDIGDKCYIFVEEMDARDFHRLPEFDGL